MAGIVAMGVTAVLGSVMGLNNTAVFTSSCVAYVAVSMWSRPAAAADYGPRQAGPHAGPDSPAGGERRLTRQRRMALTQAGAKTGACAGATGIDSTGSPLKYC